MFDPITREENENIIKNAATQLFGWICSNCDKPLTVETAMYDTVALGILYCNEQCRHEHWQKMSQVTVTFNVKEETHEDH